MSQLTDDDLRQIQVFIDRARTDLERRNLAIEIDSDLSKWVSHIRHAPGHTEIASTHDPRRSYLHPGNAFWVILREIAQPWWARALRLERPIIACLCHRVVVTDDIIDEIRTQRLFFDRTPVLDFHPVDIVKANTLPVIGGKVGVAGGFWVHPRHRGSKLSNVVSRITRILSLRHFEIDWAISLVRDTPRRKAMIHNTYGHAHSVSIIRGYYPPYGRDYDMQMSYTSREEMLQQVRQENAEAASAGTDKDHVAPVITETTLELRRTAPY